MRHVAELANGQAAYAEAGGSSHGIDLLGQPDWRSPGPRLPAPAEMFRITWHEWPRLGPTSVTAAWAALSADMQGAYLAFYGRAMRGRFVATPAYLDFLARDIGVDGPGLPADMESDAVSDRLRITEAVARIFGFIGTPALVVGRTVVDGTVSEE